MADRPRSQESLCVWNGRQSWHSRAARSCNGRGRGQLSSRGYLLHRPEDQYLAARATRRGAITEPTVARLGYFNDDNGAKYLFEIIVGVGGGSDASPLNNRYSYTYWFIEPAALDANGGLEFSHQFREGDASGEER